MFKSISAGLRLLLLTLCFLPVLGAQSQSIEGKVKDKDKQPLGSASIELISLPDSVSLAETHADSLGNFRFNNLKPGTYLLVFRHFEYQSRKYMQHVPDSGAVVLEAQLTDPVTLFSGGSIVGKKEAIKQKNDTVEYNSSAYKVNKDASAENLVTKMPGITNEDGVIKAQGEEVKKVTVDGQEFFGDDAAAALKNLPAEVVDKIQVFDRQSDQAQFTGFDDGNAQKTLNIVTKSGRSNGQFGKVYAGYGTDERWAAGGNINVFKGKQRFSFIGLSNNINQQNFSSQDILGLTGNTESRGGMPGGGRGGPQGGGRPMNYGRGDNSNFLVGQQNGINTTNSFGFNYSAFGGKKLKITASYFYNNGMNNTASLLNRTYFLGGLNQLYTQGDTGTSRNYNHRVNARLEYTFDSMNSLIWTPSVRLQRNTSASNFLGITRSQELDSLNSSFSTTDAENKGYNISNSILFRHKFRKPGNTISLNLSTSLNRSEGNSQLVSANTYHEPAFFTDHFRQNSDNTSNGYSINPSLSYTYALSTKSAMEINYNPTLSKSRSYKYTTRFDTVTNEYTITDSLLSNTFDNTSTTQRAGVTYRYRHNKLFWNIGANAQQVIMESKQSFPADRSISKTFHSILPNAHLTYQYSKTRNLRIHYRTNTNLPAINQLQNVINNSNPIILSAGNPELVQEYSHNLFARYTSTNTVKTRNFFIFGRLSMTNNFIGNSNLLATSDTVIGQEIILRKGSQLNMPVNLNGYRSFRSFATYGMPVKKLKSVLNLNLGQSLTRSPALINGQTNYSMTSNTNAGLVLASNISERIDFNINYSANYNVVQNTIQSSSNNSYLIHYFNSRFNWLPSKYIVLNTELSNSTYTGLAASFNQSIWLWNAGIGYKFMKDQRAELKLSVFDLLKQNRSISRTVTENYIEDRSTQILTRFYMLTITYNVRNFKLKTKTAVPAKD